MDVKSLQDLEFDALLELISTYAHSSASKRVLKTLRPSFNTQTAQSYYNHIREIKSRLWDSDLPMASLPDLIYLFSLRPELQTLDGIKLFQVGHFLNTVRQIYNYWQEHQKECPLTWQLVSQLQFLPDLKRRIFSSVNAQGDILDTASPRLKALRNKLQAIKAQIKRQLGQLLDSPAYSKFWQEKTITLRNNRYVVALKSEYQPFIKGIVHDYSRSKATCFVEPLEILSLNNQLQMTLNELQEEESQVLKELTYQIGLYKKELKLNYDILTQLDVYLALAQYAIEFDCCFPEFGHQLFLKSARHPILAWKEKKESGKKVVPINLKLSPPHQIAIISGPNAGGKTITLKTIGLFVLMAHSGLPLPATEVIIPHYTNVFTDIGDEQSILYETSTFSAHLQRLCEIEELASKDSLILIDEMGKGTNPTEGTALSMAFLDAFKAKDSWVVITTHLDGLKTYGLKHSEAVNIAVGIDAKSLQPTYELIYDSLSGSFALAIARKLGIKDAIWQKANFYLKKEGGQGLEVINELAQIKQKLQQKRNLIKRLLMELLALEKQYQTFLKELEERRALIYQEQKDKLNQILKRIEKEIKQRPYLPDKRRRQTLLNHKRRLKALKTTLTQKISQKPDLSPGCWVRLSSKFGNQTAQVNRILEDGVEVIIGQLKWKVPYVHIEEVIGKPPKLPSGVNVNAQRQAVSEINLLGQRTDEALSQVEKAIDSALLCGLKQMRIIHGIGTGRLKAAIWDYLKSHPQVAEFSEAPLSEGGAGVTILKIKD